MTWNRDTDIETMRAEDMPPDLMGVPVCRDPIFIIGAPRSGTTALAHALGQHSRLHTLPETHVFMSLLTPNLTDQLFERAFPETFLYTQGVDKPEFQSYLALGMNALFTSRSQGKRWVDHTPFYALIAPTLAQAFPGAKFIHILRDARKVVHSMVNMRHAFNDEINAFLERTGYQLPGWVGDFKAACHEWSRNVQAAADFCQKNPDRCLTVVNERLTADPEAGFGEMLQFLNLPEEDAPAHYFATNRVFSSFPSNGSAIAQRPDPWTEWTVEQKTIFLHQAGRPLFMLGLASQDELVALKDEVVALQAEQQAIADEKRAQEEALYQQMLARIGNAVAAAVPDGSIVLVVSYGDEGLLQLKDKTGWHFPQDVDGFYSREYPEDGGVLVRHLRDMNAKGADYLIVPAGAFWLLEEYPDFAGYLDAHARRVVDDPELLIFGLTDATVDRANPADGHTPASHETSPSPEQIGERPRVLPLDHMPVITIPPDYVTEMPRFMARMAVELGPIFRRQVPRKRQAEFGQWIVYMVGPEANRFVMHTHREHFSHDLGWTPTLTPNFERGLLNMDDPEHARDRKMMNPAFDMAHMSAYLPIITQVIADRTRDWLERGEVDLADESRKITFDIVAEALAGLQRGPQVDALRDLFYRVSRRQLSARLLGADTFVEARAELDALLLGLIRDRRAEPGDDILGMLVRASDEQGVGFTDQQLLGHLHILLAAGHETTTSLASTLLYLLTIHPEYLARVHAEIDEFTERTGGVPTIRSLRSMKVLGNALNEAGRLGTAGNGPRGVVTDFEFGGYRVPAGTRVVLSLAGGHHLPTVFRDPEKFDPDRFDPPREEHKNPPYSFVPFGGGNRPCIGMNLAQVEIKALALHVLRNYHLDVIEGQEIAQTYYAEEASIYPYGINVRVTPRA